MLFLYRFLALLLLVYDSYLKQNQRLVTKDTIDLRALLSGHFHWQVLNNNNNNNREYLIDKNAFQ